MIIPEGTRCKFLYHNPPKISVTVFTNLPVRLLILACDFDTIIFLDHTYTTGGQKKNTLPSGIVILTCIRLKSQTTGCWSSVGTCDVEMYSQSINYTHFACSAPVQTIQTRI